MAKELIETFKSKVKNWWLSLILGIMYVTAALYMMFNPIAGYGALVVMFSIMMFMTGISEIIFALSNRQSLSGWGWSLAGGVLDLVVGIILIGSPLVTAAVIPFLLAFWLMFRGFSTIGFSIEMQRGENKGWGWSMAYGVLIILCSVLILFHPLIGAVSSVLMVAFAFLFMGSFRIMVAFELRKLHKFGKEVKNRIEEIKNEISE